MDTTNQTETPIASGLFDHLVDGVDLDHRSAQVPCPNECGDLWFGITLGIKIVGCPHCQGILIESDRFAEIVHSRRASFHGIEKIPKPLDPSELRVRRHCPVCFEFMDVHPYGGPGAVVIDSCTNCNLVWLDATELTKIEQSPGSR